MICFDLRHRLLILAAGFLLASCSASVQPEQALSVAMGSEQPTSRRLAAVPLVPAEQSDALYGLVRSSGHPMKLREAAVDRLIAKDGGQFWEQIDRRVTWIDDWLMIQLLCERAVADRVESFVSTAVRSWARPSTTISDEQRPERHAILQLAVNQTPEDVVMQLCIGYDPTGEQVDLPLRQAAWAVFVRVTDDDEQRKVVRQGLPGDPFLGPLRLVSPSVDLLPAGREQLLRLQTLVDASSVDQWEGRTVYRAAAAGEDGLHATTLRHLPAIDHARAYRFWSGDALLSALRDRLTGRRHYARGEGADEAYVESRPERLADHADRLCRADLLVLLLIDDAVHGEAVRRALFEQANADRSDTTSEYGGVLVWGDAGHITAQRFVPAMRRDDRIYYASEECVTAMHTGLAHYHFHVQVPENTAWAGPGQGDIDFAEALGANCVVFTSINETTMNVDVYFPGNIVVDLGCIMRPQLSR